MSTNPDERWVCFYKDKYDEWHVSVPIPGSTTRLALFPDGIQSHDPKEHARRIVASVNACLDIEFDELERIADTGGMLGPREDIARIAAQRDTYELLGSEAARVVKRLIDQRNQLLAALIEAQAYMAGAGFVLHATDAAIAAAGGAPTDTAKDCPACGYPNLGKLIDTAQRVKAIGAEQ